MHAALYKFTACNLTPSQTPHINREGKIIQIELIAKICNNKKVTFGGDDEVAKNMRKHKFKS